jgi:transposase-like protein
MKNLRTPEEIAAFAQELIAPAIARLKPSAPSEEVAEDLPAEAEDESPDNAQPLRFVRSKRDVAPWCDVVENETESMVVELYAKGMTTRDIVNYLKSAHGIELNQSAISTITDKVYPLVKEWQSRPLSSCYAVLYLDGLYFKVREAGKISSKVAYIALGINQYGQKEVLGVWIGTSEGAKFWMHVLNDIKNRGAEDILIACVDGLKGFPEAVKAIYPAAEVQVCIVHQIRNTMKFVPHKDKKKFCEDLKPVYAAPTEEAGGIALKEMEERWPQYRSYLKSWETRWADLTPYFAYPEPIRRMIYTTNAIENLNRQFRKVTKTTTVFPHDDALLKLLWLAQADIARTWSLPVRHWGEVMAQLAILFPDRVQF